MIKKRYTKEEKNLWIEDYKKTLNITETANKFNVSGDSVSKACKKEGIEVLNRNHYTKEQVYLWAEVYRQTKKISKVVKHFNVQKETVTTNFKKYNIEKIKPKIYTQDEINIILEEYVKNKNLTQIAKKFNVNRKFLSKWCNENNIDIVKPYMNEKEQVDLWIEKYKELKNTVKVGKFFGVAPMVVYENFIKYNVDMPKRQKYTQDDMFFSKDTKEGFYWAGFIAADGSISRRNWANRLNIELNTKDRNHLIKFKNALKFTGEVTDKIEKSNQHKLGIRKSSHIGINSKQIIKDLENSI